MYKAILFDLDGTLTDSGEGITKCVQYALEKLGHPESDLDKLKVFVGPPLQQQFMEYAGFDEETAARAVELYRERFAPIGIYENCLYPGVEEMLKELADRGYILAVASSKPEKFVNTVLDMFHIREYFKVVVGAMMDGRRSDKTEVIEEALVQLGFEDHRNQVLMIGDRKYDVAGAKAAGLKCLGVSYGFGSEEELREAGALQIVSTAQGIVDFFQ